MHKTAMKQILDKGYHRSIQARLKEIILVGVNFDTKSRSLNDWCTNSIE